MKGLIRNTFYSMEDNVKIAFLMSAILIFMPFFTKEPTILTIIISVQIFVFIANIGTALHADETAKWNKFERTLPVNQNVVILAKYISFSLLIVFGFMISILTGIIAVSTTSSLSLGSLIWGYEYGLTLSIMVAAIMYPAMLKFGTEKNELIILLCSFLSVGFISLIALLLSPITAGMNGKSLFVGAVSVVVSLLLLCVSYFISLRIYKNKEF